MQSVFVEQQQRTYEEYDLEQALFRSSASVDWFPSKFAVTNNPTGNGFFFLVLGIFVFF